MIGGTERYVGDLARRQVQGGHRVTVVTLDRDVNGIVSGSLPGRESRDGVEVVRLPGLGSPRFGLTYRPDVLVRQIRRSDVTHIHDIRFMLGTTALAARLARHRTLLHTHGLIFGTRAFWRLKLLLSRLYYAPLLRATNAFVVCSSDSDRARLLMSMPGLGPRSRTIPSAVDLAPFLTVDRSPIAAEVVVVGRVTPLKGIDRAIRALPHLADTAVRLSIHGEGEGGERDRLNRLTRSLGVSESVRTTGAYSVDEEPALFAGASLALFPSTSEGLPGALVDAMASGVPILASDIPPHRELLEPVDPSLLVDFDQPAAVAEAIARMLARSGTGLAELSTRLRERARFYDVSRLANDVETLYAELGVVAH